MDLFDLTGKTALVTGGTRGLGAGMARALSAAGASVVTVGRSLPERPSPDITHFRVDLADADQREGLVGRAIEELGSLDILLHAAGNIARYDAEDYPAEVLDDILTLHVRTGMDLAQQAARHMLERGSGKIILVGSVLSFQGGLKVCAYTAAKHAVVGLVRSLANEWASRGVNVNGIAPGYFNTAMARGAIEDPVRGPGFLARIPAGRFGDPDADLAGAAVFLASRASDYIHGHTVAVDGGWLSR